MLTRRGFIVGLLLVPCVAAAQSKPELWSGKVVDKAGPGTVVVAEQHVRLHNRFTPKEIVLYSASNDNQKFTFWIVAPIQHTGDYQYLKIENDWWGSNGTGSDSEGTKTSFQFDRATARRVADAFGVSLYERKKLDDGLVYAFKFPPKAKTNKQTPIEVTLRVENRGQNTVGFMVGGRQRGPRDNRFSYVISKDGKPVAIKSANDFGGPGGYIEIKPGDSTEVKCADLRAWADLDQPGVYAIEAKYEGELAKDGKMPRAAAERANRWDIVATGQGSIVIE